MILYNANILTMEGESFPNGYVEVDESSGKVARVGDMAALVPPYAGIDARGAALLPGFIDAHCHLGMFGDGLGFEGDDGNESTDPLTPHLRAIDAVNPLDRCFEEAVDAGITCVLTGMGSANPIGGQWVAMKTHGRRVDDMVFCAPAAMKFALGENPKTVYHERNQAPNSRMATAAIIREQLTKARRYMEDEEQAASDEEFDKPEYDAKCEALLPVLRGEVKAHFHCHRADDIFTAIRIAKEFSLDLVLVHCTEGHLIARELAAEQVCAVVGPVLCDRSKPELRNLSISCAAALSAQGVPIAVCTDHPVAPIQYLPVAAALCVKGGLPRERALAAITIDAARICGIAGRVGSIKAGKDADLVLFEGDPLDVQASPRLVMIGGKIVREYR